MEPQCTTILYHENVLRIQHNYYTRTAVHIYIYIYFENNSTCVDCIHYSNVVFKLYVIYYTFMSHYIVTHD